MTRDELQGRQLLALGLASESQLAALWPRCQPQRDLLSLATEQGLVGAGQAEGLRALLARGNFEGLLPLRELNRGGMGVLYEALELASGRRVVIKQVLGEADEAARLRFRREAQALARVQHPNVVRVLGFGEGRGGPYFTQERIEGEVLSEAAGLGEEELRRIGLALCDALEAIHEAGLIHRDVKPDNVMIEAGTGRVVLLDFGLARAQTQRDEGLTIEQRLTQTSDELGSPAYMAPEQFDAATFGAPGPKTDVWGLCATLAAGAQGTPPLGFSAWAWDRARAPGRAGPYVLKGTFGERLIGGLAAEPSRRITLAELRESLLAEASGRLSAGLALLCCGLATAVALAAAVALSEGSAAHSASRPELDPRQGAAPPEPPESAPDAPEGLLCPSTTRRAASALADLPRWRGLSGAEKQAIELWALSQLGSAFDLELQALPGPGEDREGWVAVHVTGIALRLIPGGRMTLGSTEAQAELRRALVRKHSREVSERDLGELLARLDERMSSRERPAVELRVPPLLVAIYETSKAEFRRGMHRAPLKTVDGPLVGQRWPAVSKWCQDQPGGLRLPWSAEWEFAASCGDDRIFPWGDAFDPSRLWCAERFGDDEPQAMRRRRTPSAHANDFGLFDMAGGVWEWNADSELARGALLHDTQLSSESYSGMDIIAVGRGSTVARDLARAFEAWGRFGTQQAHLLRGGAFDSTSPASFVIEEKAFLTNNTKDPLLQKTGFRVVASLPDAVLDAVYEEDE